MLVKGKTPHFEDIHSKLLVIFIYSLRIFEQCEHVGGNSVVPSKQILQKTLFFFKVMDTHKALHRTVIKHLLVYFLELFYQKYWFCDTETLAYYVGSLNPQ